MSVTVTVDAFAALLRGGIVTHDGLTPWDADQHGAADVRRAQVLERPYPSFGKLALPDKLAFSTVSLMLRHYRGSVDEATGVCLEIPFGSLSCDLRYNESVASGFPSPALFAATLPSSPVSEVTIFHKLKGPNRVFAGRSSGGLSALDAAWRALACRKAEKLVVAYVNALDEADRGSPHAEAFPDAAAYALLLTAGNGNHLGVPCTVDLQGESGEPVQDATEYFPLLLELLAKGGEATVAVRYEGYRGSVVLGKGRQWRS
jgi:hypothetical protein